MANVLFVKANGRPADQAISVKLYDAFISAYKEAHPNDTVSELDLFAEHLPYYDNATLMGLFKQGKGMELTAEEKQAADIANKYTDQFLAADKVVFAFPLWNFTIPAQLVTYISYLCQAGKTFQFTPEGSVGLAGSKKVALLNARGGIFSEGPAASREMSVNYMKVILDFFGIKDVETVVIEGHKQFPDRADQIIEDGLAQAVKLAASF